MSLDRTNEPLETLILTGNAAKPPGFSLLRSVRQYGLAASLAFVITAAVVLAWAFASLSPARTWRALLALPLAVVAASVTAIFAQRRDTHIHSEADVQAALGDVRLIALPLLGDASSLLASEYEQGLATLLEREHARGASTVALTPASPSTGLHALLSSLQLRLVAQGIRASLHTIDDGPGPRQDGPDAASQAPALRLIAAPPLIAVDQADHLAVLADAILLVLTSGVTTRDDLVSCWRRLQEAGVRHVWVVLRDVPRLAASAEMRAAMDHRGSRRPERICLLDGEPEPAVLQKQVYDIIQRRADRETDGSAPPQLCALFTPDAQPPEDRPSTFAAEDLEDMEDLTSTALPEKPADDTHHAWAASQESIMHMEPAALRHDLARAEFTDANVADDLPDSAPAVRRSFFRFLDRRSRPVTPDVEAEEIERAFARVLKRPDRSRPPAAADAGSAPGTFVWKRLEELQAEHPAAATEPPALHPPVSHSDDLAAFESAAHDQQGSPVESEAISALVPAPSAGVATPEPRPLYEIPVGDGPDAHRPVLTALPSDAAAIALRMAAMPTAFDFPEPVAEPPEQAASRLPKVDAERWLHSAEADRIRRVLAKFSDPTPHDPEPLRETMWFGEHPQPSPAGNASDSPADSTDPLHRPDLRFGVSAPQPQPIAAPPAAPSPASLSAPESPDASAAGSKQPSQVSLPQAEPSFPRPAESLAPPPADDATPAPGWPLWPAALEPRSIEHAAFPTAAGAVLDPDPLAPPRPWLELLEHHFRPDASAVPIDASATELRTPFAAEPGPGLDDDRLTAAEPWPLTTVFTATEPEAPLEASSPASAPFPAAAPSTIDPDAAGTVPLSIPAAEAARVGTPADAPAQPALKTETASPGEEPTPWKTRKPPVALTHTSVDLTPQPHRWGMLRLFDPHAGPGDSGPAYDPQSPRFADSGPRTPAAG